MTTRRIVFVIFDGLQPLDLVGPHEVFSYAGRLSPDGEYRCQVAARAAGPVRTPSGLLVHAAHSVSDLDPAGIDTLLVAGGALTEGDNPVDAIARRCGFGTAETLRRVFQRRLGVAPSEYRDRFRLTPLKETP